MTRLMQYLILIIAAIAVSWAAIFIRLADADPIAIAFYRMALAVLILAPLSAVSSFRKLTKLTKRNLLLLSISGLFLGIHFASWIASLKYTSIANSVIIVSTHPFLIAIAEAIILKTKIGRWTIIGMILAISGMIVIFSSSLGFSNSGILGELLAFIGAVCAAGYLLTGRIIRQDMKNRDYIFLVYLFAALILSIIALITNTSLFGFDEQTWLFFVLLALIPQVIGHSLYNFLLKHMKAHLVGLAILGEPIGASFLAILIFSEFPPTETYIGGGLILAGIALALIRMKSDDKSVETA
ncbi:MAG: DMT family transporter [candidate division Zixibacteria bacterium]